MTKHVKKVVIYFLILNSTSAFRFLKNADSLNLSYAAMHSIDLIQSSYTTILQYIVQNGRAPHYAELAKLLEVVPDTARELQRETAAAAPAGGCWMSHETDYIESWAPFSIVPTQHLISIGGVKKWYGQ